MLIIEEDNKKHFERFKNEPPSPSYVAGFIDGDGCIFIRKIKNGYQSGISIAQSRTNILQILRYHFGGSITSSKNRNNKHDDISNNDIELSKNCIRNQYNLIIRSNEYEIILKYLQNSFIIKDKLYKCLIDFSKLVDIPNKNEEKENIYQKYLINKSINEYNISRVNIDYIAGIFDAEGCFYINKYNYNKFYISIVQKNNPMILNEILRYIGFGNISEDYRLKIYNKKDCLMFISLIKKLLIVKYNQAEAFEIFLNTNEFNIKEKMYLICNEEKHKIEIFDNLNQHDNGKNGYLERVNLYNIKIKICKEIINKEIYKNKSKCMKGEGNHNYGKKISDETKRKMSISIRKAKGGLDDETIIHIRNLIKEGYKNIDIQNSLNLPRHTITRVKNGKISCSFEI